MKNELMKLNQPSSELERGSNQKNKEIKRKRSGNVNFHPLECFGEVVEFAMWHVEDIEKKKQKQSETLKSRPLMKCDTFHNT